MPGPSGLQSVAADAEYYADLNHAVDASLLFEDRNSQDETDRRFQYDSPTGRLTNMEIAVTETLRWMRTNPVGKFLQINFHLVLLNMREQYPGVYDGTDRHVFHTISRWVHGAADRRHLGRNALCVPRSRIGHVAQEEHTIINHLTDKLISLLNENSSTIHRNYLGGSYGVLAGGGDSSRTSSSVAMSGQTGRAGRCNQMLTDAVRFSRMAQDTAECCLTL